MSEKQTCAGQVWQRDNWRSKYRPCTKPAGHGKDAAYCKIHAAKHPADDSQFVKMFRAYFFVPMVEEIDVQSFTDLTLVSKSGNRENRERYGGFYAETRQEAIERIRQYWQGEKAKHEQAIERANRALAKVEGL